MSERYFLGKWRRMALYFTGTVYLSSFLDCIFLFAQKVQFLFALEIFECVDGHMEGRKAGSRLGCSVAFRPEDTPPGIRCDLIQAPWDPADGGHCEAMPECIAATAHIFAE